MKPTDHVTPAQIAKRLLAEWESQSRRPSLTWREMESIWQTYGALDSYYAEQAEVIAAVIAELDETASPDEVCWNVPVGLLRHIARGDRSQGLGDNN